MRIIFPFAIFLFLSVTVYAPTLTASANEPTTLLQRPRFNNQNWQITTQPEIATFTSLPNGDSFGITTDGTPFKQYTVSEIHGVKIQRFELEDHYHFIVNGQIAFSLEALSAVLATLQ